MAVPENQRVVIEEGVVFGHAGGRDLKCDVFTPPPGVANSAGVLLVHGGGWRNGDRRQLRGYGILLGRIGYTCVASEYRLSGEAKWPACLSDTKAALRWMHANAARLGIDPAKIIVSGNSAGGHLSLMIAGTQNMPEFEGDSGNPGAPTTVAACSAFYAPASLIMRRNHRREVEVPDFDAIPELMGPHHTDDDLIAASPITYAANYPPTLLFHGTKDALVPWQATTAMHEALSAANVPVEMHVYEGLPHGFDALPDFGRQAAQVMALFFDRHVVRPRQVTLPVATQETAATAAR